jgi:hypothetical protein
LKSTFYHIPKYPQYLSRHQIQEFLLGISKKNKKLSLVLVIIIVLKPDLGVDPGPHKIKGDYYQSFKT